MKYWLSVVRRSRFDTFKGNLKEVDVLNAAVKARNGTEVYGITRFSDFESWELRSGTVKQRNFKNNFFASPGVPVYETTSAERMPYGETRHRLYYDAHYN